MEIKLKARFLLKYFFDSEDIEIFFYGKFLNKIFIEGLSRRFEHVFTNKA